MRIVDLIDEIYDADHHHEIFKRNAEDHHNDSMDDLHQAGGHHGVRLASWRWEEVSTFYVVVGFIVLNGLAKILFHHTHAISSRIPESCLLILSGIVFGAILESTQDGRTQNLQYLPEFGEELFFYYLLPPIILEAAYSLYDRVFLDNLRTILLYAVPGTILNFVMIGGLLLMTFNAGLMGSAPVCDKGNNVLEVLADQFGGEGNLTEDITALPNITLLGGMQNATESLLDHRNLTEDDMGHPTDLSGTNIFLFASLISAVDPVAVLAIFSEVSVNADLYYLVFGESLFNDAVAVVLYNTMKVLATIEAEGGTTTSTDYLLGIGSFFTVALGGLIIGFHFGFLTALVTKYTKDVHVSEPLVVFGLAYLSYLSAELVHWSGIISLIGCGLVQSHYAFKNISEDSRITVRHFIQMLSSTSDCIIFLYLGLEVLRDHCRFWGFTLWTLVFCLLVRFIVVFSLTYIVNRLYQGVKRINFREQFIMSYGGLRGAVGYSLVLLINTTTIPAAEFFVTTTLVVVMVTTFVQGSTIKPFVKLLDIKLADNAPKTINEELSEDFIDHLMGGIERIIGKKGHFYYLSMFDKVDKKYLIKIFTRGDYKKINEEQILSGHLTKLYGEGIASGASRVANEAVQSEGVSGANLAHVFPSKTTADSSTFELEGLGTSKKSRVSQRMENLLQRIPESEKLRVSGILERHMKKRRSSLLEEEEVPS